MSQWGGSKIDFSEHAAILEQCFWRVHISTGLKFINISNIMGDGVLPILLKRSEKMSENEFYSLVLSHIQELPSTSDLF